MVDRQLMSSLMGEWGMLQQLQGLANTFIIASPAMVEWVDALFTAVECTRPPRDSSRPGGVSTPTSASKTLPRTSAMSGGLYSGSPGLVGSPRGGAGAASAAIASGMAVHVEHLEVTSLAALLQVSCGSKEGRILQRGHCSSSADERGCPSKMVFNTGVFFVWSCRNIEYNTDLAYVQLCVPQTIL
jgi:hypothetical protein